MRIDGFRGLVGGGEVSGFDRDVLDRDGVGCLIGWRRDSEERILHCVAVAENGHVWLHLLRCSKRE